MTTDLIHLSWSGLSSYMQCPLKYKFYYVDHLQTEFTSASLHFGACMHDAIGGFLQMQQQGDSLTEAQMMDVFTNAWQAPEGKLRFAPREDEDSLLEKARNLMGLYIAAYDPSTIVLSVEESFAVNLGSEDSTFELPLFTGVIDAMTAVGERTTLVDYKTSARKPNGNVNELQLVGYSLAAKEMGFEPNELDYRFDYLIKTKEPDLVQVPVTITDHDRERFLKLVTRVWAGIKQAVFYPNPLGFYCGNCGYQSHCRAW